MAHGPPTRGEARTCQPVVRRVGRVKCVAVFSARVWEREAFKADRADLDALASRGWHGGGAGGRRARLWDRSTALRPSTRASMARTTDWTLTQRGIAQGRSLQGPAGHHDTECQFPDERAVRPHRLAAALFATLRHARRRGAHPGTHPSTSDSPVRSSTRVSQTSKASRQREKNKLSPTRRALKNAFALPRSIGVRLLALAAFTTGFIRQLEMGPRAICSVCAFAAATRGANHARAGRAEAGLTYNGYGRGIARSGRAPPERWLLLQ